MSKEKTATVIITINRKKAVERHVPQSDMVAWIEKHGMVQSSRHDEVFVTANLETWAAAGERINADGLVGRVLKEGTGSEFHCQRYAAPQANRVPTSLSNAHELRKTVEKHYIKHGDIGTAHVRVLRELKHIAQEKVNQANVNLSIQLENKLKQKEREEQSERAKKRKAADLKARELERDTWIKEHGSERLQKILQLGFAGDSWGLYRNERLKAEFKEWRWDFDCAHKPVRSPSMEALECYERALKHDGIQNPKLVYLQWTDEDDQGFLVTRHNVVAIYASILGHSAYCFIGDVKETELSDY